MKKLLVIIFLSAFVPLFGGTKIKDVKIYHVPWDVLTFANMTAEEVRKTAPFKIQITDAIYAERFVRALAEDKMSSGNHLPIADIRLVIDITGDDGSVTSFCASRFELGAQKSGKKRTIDDSFRARFTALYEEKG
jgi:hypothetical protein